MRLEPEQLVRFARLTDEWVDVAEDRQAGWLATRQREHPDLAAALSTLTGEQAPGRSTGADPLSLPGLDLEGPHPGDGHLPGDRVGPYRLLSLLGRGGMGAVWLAEQIDGRLSRKLALKLPLPGQAHRDWRRRFERERDILAGLDHPGIAKLFDAGTTPDGQPYLAMQYVVGDSLLRHAQTQGLSLAARVRLFVELLGVVQHAHAALVVHRDLKPGNIMVDDQGRVMLLDFGIAKLLQAPGPQPHGGEVTEFAGSALTLDYASPEQVAGLAISTRTDIYSLGVVLYELLAGRRPYHLRRASRAATEEAVLEQEVKPPSSRATAEHTRSMGASLRASRRQLRGDLDAIVLKALRKLSEQRYATAQGFADDLQRWLRKEPVSAQPDAWSYRTRRLLVRHWQWAALGMAMSAVLIGFTVVALLQARQAERASVLARSEARRAEAVTGFLMNLFDNNSMGQADPETSRKRTAEQLMDDAASRIGTALAGAPEQQIVLLHRMASAYHGMRLPGRAVELQRDAAKLAARVYGPGDPRTRSEQIDWMFFTAVDSEAEDFDPELQPLVKSLPTLAASPREDERQLALRLADVLMNWEFIIRAEVALRYADLVEPILSNTNAKGENINRHHMLGVVYLQNLRLTDAARHLGIVERWAAEQGPAAAWAESFPTWNGRQQELAGHYAQADALMQTGYAMERRNDAGGDRLNDWCLAQYVRYLADTGRAAQGLTWVRSGGPLAHPRIRSKLSTALRSTVAEAHALAKLGRGEEALARSRQAEQWMREQEPESRRPPLPMLMEALLILGRPDEALKLLDIEEPRMAEGRASSMGRLLSEYRIRGLTATGRPSEARAYLESRRAILMPAGGGPAEEARLAWLESGVALLEGQPDQANRVLQAGLQRLAQAGADDRIYLSEWQARLQDRLGDTASALGDTAGARTAYESALRGYEQVVDPAVSMTLGRVAERLAALARQRNDAATARRLQARADAIAARHPGQRGWGA